MQLTDEQQNQVIALTRELVQANSPSGHEREAAEIAARWMKSLDYDEVWTDDYGSVIGRRQGKEPGKNLHFDGHLDVVAVTAPDTWRYPPFSAHVANGRIWGRGTTDMKGPVAAMLCAAAFLPREAFKGTITVSASVGEEGWEGVSLTPILREHPADAVIIGEPTGLGIGFAQKGRAGVALNTQGKAAHASMPHEGVNAIYKMFEAVERVRAMVLPTDEVVGPGITELVEIISSPYPGDAIVPDGCRALFDRRLVPGETQESVLEEVRAALSDFEGVTAECPELPLVCFTGAKLTVPEFHPAWMVPQESALVQAALTALRGIGLPETLLAVPFCTNGSASAGEMGIPTIILGPSEVKLAHIIDEYIETEQLLSGTVAYAALAQTYLG